MVQGPGVWLRVRPTRMISATEQLQGVRVDRGHGHADRLAFRQRCDRGGKMAPAAKLSVVSPSARDDEARLRLARLGAPCVARLAALVSHPRSPLPGCPIRR